MTGVIKRIFIILGISILICSCANVQPGTINQNYWDDDGYEGYDSYLRPYIDS